MHKQHSITTINKIAWRRWVEVFEILSILEWVFLGFLGLFGGLGILWKAAEVSVDVIYSSSNWMAAKAYDIELNCHLLIINIYGPIKTEDKASLWDFVLSFSRPHLKEKLIIGGDFNAILDISEKIGGVKIVSQARSTRKKFIVYIQFG